MIRQNTAKAVPQTLAQLESELERIDFILLKAQRGRNSARATIPSLMANGDDPGVEESREEIKRLTAQIGEFSELREQTEEALAKVQSGMLAHSRAQTFSKLQRTLSNVQRDAAECDKLAEDYGKSLHKLRDSVDTADSELNSCGLSYDPYAFKALIDGIAGIALYISTEGLFGKARTLESMHELQQNGRGSLQRTAREYVAVKLRAAGDLLGIDRGPPEAT